MTADDVIHRLCAFRQITVLQVRGPSRCSSISLARHEAMWLVREATELSLPEIARKFGRSDHTTALHGIRKIQRLVDGDPVYGDQLRDVGMITAAAQREAVKRDVAWLEMELASRRARLRDLSQGRRRHREAA